MLLAKQIIVVKNLFFTYNNNLLGALHDNIFFTATLLLGKNLANN